MDKQIADSNVTPGDLFKSFVRDFNTILKASAADPEVVGFKSIACYRTGLDISTSQDPSTIERAIMTMLLVYVAKRDFRLADKPINDFIVNMTMRISGECGKPGTSLSEVRVGSLRREPV